MIRELAIYGAGGFGRELALMVEQINAVHSQWEIIGFFDDGKRVGEIVDGHPVVGGLKEVNEWPTSLALVVALADPVVRKQVVTGIINSRISFPVMIHPRSIPGSSQNTFGSGSIITAGCILTTGIGLGEFVIVNLSCTIGHDAKVGSYTSIMPGCNISGSVKIGEHVLIGTGAQILQNLSIGSDSRIGAGAVVVNEVENGKTVVGVPAQVRK